MSDRSTIRDLARSVGLEVLSSGVDDLIRSSGAFIRVVYGAADMVAEAFFNDIVIIDDVVTHNADTVKSWIAAMGATGSKKS